MSQLAGPSVHLKASTRDGVRWQSVSYPCDSKLLIRSAFGQSDMSATLGGAYRGSIRPMTSTYDHGRTTMAASASGPMELYFVQSAVIQVIQCGTTILHDAGHATPPPF